MCLNPTEDAWKLRQRTLAHAVLTAALMIAPRLLPLMCGLTLIACAESATSPSGDSSAGTGGGAAGAAGSAGASGAAGTTPDGAANDAAMSDGAVEQCVQYEPGPMPREPEPCVTSDEGPCATIFLDQRGLPFEQAQPGMPTRTTLEEVRCLLRALRDRVPGQLWFVTEYSPGWGSGSLFLGETRHGYHVLPDGTAIGSVSRVYDLSSEKSWQHATIKPAAFFEDCLELDFGEALYECLTQWKSALTPNTCPVCDAS